MNDQTIEWLRIMATVGGIGGKGIVNNIDARALGRVADEIERLQAEVKFYIDLSNKLRDENARLLRLCSFDGTRDLET